MLDGIGCLMREGTLFSRQTLTRGEATPKDFIAVSSDQNSGRKIGWVPAGGGDKDSPFREAFNRLSDVTDGTYELIGPDVHGNPEHARVHRLVFHRSGGLLLANVPRTYQGLSGWFIGRDIEGVVFRHPDGRLAKIKGIDFGIPRRAEAPAEDWFGGMFNEWLAS